jgi:hypothetical protein
LTVDTGVSDGFRIAHRVVNNRLTEGVHCMLRILKRLVPVLLAFGIVSVANDAEASRHGKRVKKSIPEFSSNAAGASLVLVGGGLLAIAGRRRKIQK